MKLLVSVAILMALSGAKVHAQPDIGSGGEGSSEPIRCLPMPVAPCQDGEVVESQCKNDTDCGQDNACCPYRCGATICQEIYYPAKQGVCPAIPIVIPSKEVQRECTTDNNCPGDEKCCRNLYGGTNCTKPGSPKKGFCPVVEPAQCFAPPQFQCANDNDCEGESNRCCAEPCGGSMCTQTVKPLRCPPAEECTGSDCEEECSNDYSCDGSQKCCSTQRGQVCIEPDTKEYQCPPFIAIACLNNSNPRECEDDSMCPTRPNTVSRCCPFECGGTRCVGWAKPVDSEPQPPVTLSPSPVCPRVDVRCPNGADQAPRMCETDSDCPPKGDTVFSCCPRGCGGTFCLGISPPLPPNPNPSNPQCPGVREIGCVNNTMPRECEVDSNCTRGQICCPIECEGTKCVTATVRPPQPPVGPPQPPQPQPSPECPVFDLARPCNESVRERRECETDENCKRTGDTAYSCCPLPCGGSYCLGMAPPLPPGVPPKKGMCPARAGPIGICGPACANDHQCPGDQKCCNNGCGLNCVAPEIEEYNRCPPIILIGCINHTKPRECEVDSNCTNGQICCGIECEGTKCVDPFVRPPQPPVGPPQPPQTVKSGTCPAVRRGETGDCAMTCTQDSDCRDVLKCCSNGCGGRSCRMPTPICYPFTSDKVCDQVGRRECETELDCPMNGDTSYSCCPTECNGTRCIGIAPPLPPPIIPEPETTGQCPKFDRTLIDCAPATPESERDECTNTSDSSCPPGLKCCEQACTGKRCVQPTQRDWVCKGVPEIGCMTPWPRVCDTDDVCSLDQKCCETTCGGKKCMTRYEKHKLPGQVEPQPPVGKPGRCPPVESKPMDGCEHECFNDTSCAGDMKCCHNACGRVCTAPDMIPDTIRPGECPTYDNIEILCVANATKVNKCRQDSDCTDGIYKCCKTPCDGLDCRAPVPTTVVVKQGSCPVMPPGSFGTCVEACSGDGSCPDDTKCCSNGCGHTCMKPVTQTRLKPGQCPVLPPGTIGTCVEMCSGDNSCPGDEKCCSNGCGHVCKKPETQTRLKPGQCPVLPPGTIGTCVEMCSGDGSCPGDEKCCSNGCGHVCKKPEPEPPCDDKPAPSKADPRCPIVDRNIVCIRENSKLCSNNSDCSDGKICCATECNGTACKLPGRPGTCPFIDRRLILCAPPVNDSQLDNCREDTDCTNNSNAKCCEQGCTGRRCVEPQIVADRQCEPIDPSIRCIRRDDVMCYDNTNCDNGTICCNTPCRGSKCTSPPPKPRSGECPKIDRTIIRCPAPTNDSMADECRTDSDCTSNNKYKCCEQGCTGRRCIEPLTDEICPAVDPQIQCIRRGDVNCYSNSDCKDDQVCCGAICGGSTCIDRNTIRPGKCPVVDRTTVKCMAPTNESAADECTKDSDCKSENNKCCEQACTGRRCIEPEIVVDKSCAPVNTSIVCITRGEVNCYSNFDCRDGQVCCGAPCGGSECKAQTLPPPEPRVKPGDCPPLNPMLGCPQKLGGCEGDHVCEGDLKCCPTDCSDRKCVKPVNGGLPGNPGTGFNGQCPEFNLAAITCLVFTNETAADHCKVDTDCGEARAKCCAMPCSGRRCHRPDSSGQMQAFKPGSCPKFNDTGMVSICLVECENDMVCNGTQKCCQMGCNRKCVAPANTTSNTTTLPPRPQPEDPKVKPGSCPKFNDTGMASICLVECENDMVCNGTDKCCTMGCHRRCVAPANQINPDINNDENKNKTRDDGSGGGNPGGQPGGQPGGPNVAKVKPGKCPKTVAWAKGCKVQDECDGDESCAGDMKCCSGPCGKKCRNSGPGKKGQCPYIYLPKCGMKQYPIKCEDDSGCFGRMKCCGYKCDGSMCLHPEIMPARCPFIYPELTLCAGPIPADTCSSDNDCQGNEMCCQTECQGKTCVMSEKNGFCPNKALPLAGCAPGQSPSDWCETDFDCTGNSKCCYSSTPCGGKQCTAPSLHPHSNKPGTCPNPSPGGQRPVCPDVVPKDGCRGDIDCSGDTMCCQTACQGLQCVQPENANQFNPQCPKPEDDSFGPCVVECRKDSDCTQAGKVCCPNPCGGGICVTLTSP